jgi:hypothetical protein
MVDWTPAASAATSALCYLSSETHRDWYQDWYHGAMAMTLRLDDDETEALRSRAEHEGRSMQEVARQAVREYVERTSRRELLDRVLDEELPRYAEALRRLGE